MNLVVLTDVLREVGLDHRGRQLAEVQPSETGRVIAVTYALYVVGRYERLSNDVPSHESLELEGFKAGGLSCGETDSLFCECERWRQQGFKQGHKVVSLCFPELAIKLARVEEMCFTRSCGSCDVLET